MRSAVLASTLFAVLLSLGVVSCSARVPATITAQPGVPFDRSETIVLDAARQRPRILQSLEDAGLSVANKVGAGGYSLVVKEGGARSSRDCGTVNNVAYILRGGGQRLVIKARGPTGRCVPNIFDEMSRKLAGSMAE